MELPSFYILLLCVLSQSLHCCCQQVYLNNTVYDCSANPSIPKGYLCNGLQKSCTSFITFRAKPPYDTPLSIAYLLGSEASSIASINNISSNDKNIPSNQTVIVPIYCSCSGNIYQHATPYTVRKADTYYQLVNATYQGLASCQALMGQNYYAPVNIPVGAQLTVPVICACPTAKQTTDGVSSLLVYTLNYGDSLESAAQAYGVDQHTLLTANQLPPNASISAFTPLLLPLQPSACKLNPHTFYCTCSHSQESLPDPSFNTLFCDHHQTVAHHFPLKLVASLGNFFSIKFLDSMIMMMTYTSVLSSVAQVADQINRFHKFE